MSIITSLLSEFNNKDIIGAVENEIQKAKKVSEK
jgi:hypothetical protein